LKKTTKKTTSTKKWRYGQVQNHAHSEGQPHKKHRKKETGVVQEYKFDATESASKKVLQSRSVGPPKARRAAKKEGGYQQQFQKISPKAPGGCGTSLRRGGDTSGQKEDLTEGSKTPSGKGKVFGRGC